MIKLLLGDSAEILKTLESNSVDSVVTDPPAGISFMGKEWDSHKGGRDQWINWLSSIFVEVHRILKPGGHCFVWGLPRTSHWTGMALEDAGFEIRDCVYHVFGSGFPKSLNIGKAVDILQGNERKITGYAKSNPDLRDVGRISKENCGIDKLSFGQGKGCKRHQTPIDKGTSKFEGWGTGLKPAVECWWLVRKPLSEKIIAENVLKWGTGGINIDGCRVELEENSRLEKGDSYSGNRTGSNVKNLFNSGNGIVEYSQPQGRFPSNFIHDGSEEVLSYFPNAKGQQGDLLNHNHKTISPNGIYGTLSARNNTYKRNEEEMSAARFFYCSKPSPSERQFGCENLEKGTSGLISNTSGQHITRRDGGAPLPKGNNHPTVKSIKLMSYLCKLITPPKDVILDPFMGGGSTGIAAKINSFSFIGIEKEEPYLKIAEARIKAYTIGKVTIPKVKKEKVLKVEVSSKTVQNPLFE